MAEHIDSKGQKDCVTDDQRQPMMPLVETIRRHVFASERIHADDTTVPVLAKGKTRTGRLWTYVRDDRPFAGPEPPAAAFFYSRDRGGEHPQQHLASYAGLMQADAYAGFNRLYEANRKPGPIVEAACWAHGRRKFFDLARINKAPIAEEALRASMCCLRSSARSTA
jgi:transposase